MATANSQGTQEVWAVAEVHRGIPVDVRIYLDLTQAQDYESTIRRAMNSEVDEVGIFAAEIPQLVYSN